MVYSACVPWAWGLTTPTTMSPTPTPSTPWPTLTTSPAKSRPTAKRQQFLLHKQSGQRVNMYSYINSWTGKWKELNLHMQPCFTLM